MPVYERGTFGFILHIIHWNRIGETVLFCKTKKLYASLQLSSHITCVILTDNKVPERKNAGLILAFARH